MDTLTIEKPTDERESFESWEIESQLAEIGVPYLSHSWQDEFLMAENLQNYFAEVIAGYSLLEMQEEEKENPNPSKIKFYEEDSLKFIRISLMKTSKEITNLRDI
jgi:hypothetical protein